MKQKYIDLMEKALSAYSDEHIQRYFEEVRQNGLTEHGFPRLTANIGILISHDRCTNLAPIFVEMMDLCCTQIHQVKAANDFSVREIICCLREIEAANAVDACLIQKWKADLCAIKPTKCYNIFAKSPEDNVKNWALFSGVSEFFRQSSGLCDSEQFIDTQIASQLKWIDENGMYMDGKGDVHHPIMYDLVARGLFVLLLNEGYKGKYYRDIDACLERSALMTLCMQSSNGEMAYGGRSNQFLFCEAWMMTVYEYEAKRYAQRGDYALAAKFKAATRRAIEVTEHWLSLSPIRHIKNRFPTETSFGCEKYAYFDKYMITTASNLYAAYIVCDDSIEYAPTEDILPSVAQTSNHFHKLFLKSSGYSLELDTNADPAYDASGIGRIHKAGAPSAICLSVPCPSAPAYSITPQEPSALALCPAVLRDGKWVFATGEQTIYAITNASHDGDAAFASLKCLFLNDACIDMDIQVNSDGVKISLRGNGKLGFMLPAFYCDGERYTDIRNDTNSLRILYNGYVCKYTTDGQINGTKDISANRNGYYKSFIASAEDRLCVSIAISAI